MTERALHVADFRLLLHSSIRCGLPTAISIDRDRYQEVRESRCKNSPTKLFLNRSHTRGNTRALKDLNHNHTNWCQIFKKDKHHCESQLIIIATVVYSHTLPPTLHSEGNNLLMCNL